jgi:hypothetical protein
MIKCIVGIVYRCSVPALLLPRTYQYMCAKFLTKQHSSVRKYDPLGTASLAPRIFSWNVTVFLLFKIGVNGSCCDSVRSQFDKKCVDSAR